MTAPIRCLYAYRTIQRPTCQLIATVAYGTIGLCAPCNDQRSTLGKGQIRRQLPAVAADPLDLLIDANTQLTTATEQLQSAVTRARQHHATWDEIGRVLGTTRQAAQQRFTRT